MNLLLDSHALLWALSAPDKIKEAAAREIRNPQNAVFFSAISVWELELKAAKGKLFLPKGWVNAARETGFTELLPNAECAAASVRLPWHHGDPFDRLLVAQAQQQGFTFATRDAFIRLYDVQVLLV